MLRDEPGGCPFSGQAGSGMEAARARSAAFVWNRRRRIRMRLAGVSVGGREKQRVDAV